MIAGLLESDVDFVAADMPLANRFTIHIQAAVAEYEARLISERTKAAFAAAKARGRKFGSPNPVTYRFSYAARKARVGAERERSKRRALDFSTFSSRCDREKPLDSRSGIVGGPQIRELGKQIDVGPDLVPGHLPVCEDC